MKFFISFYHRIARWHEAKLPDFSSPLNRYVMRINLTLFVWTVISLQVASANLVAQEITLKANNTPLQEVFNIIRKQSGYQFFYKNNSIAKGKAVTLELKAVPLRDALPRIMQSQPLRFEIVDKTVVIMEAAPASKKEAVENQQTSVSGRITGSGGQPLAGVTVRNTTRNISSGSDRDGRYIIPAGKGDALLFSFIGLQTVEQTVGSRMEIDVELREASSQLDQVMIQGYGSTTQRLSTGNIATIKADEISQQTVTNPLQALSGRVSGVQITQFSGIPGTSIQIQIRGQNSIGASNNPLYIVDNVPFHGENLSAVGSLSAISPLNSLSPNDIESITILKDADATAIYGSRAANGVVLITTKKGKAGKTKLDLSYNRGFSSAGNIPEIMTTAQYLQMRKDAFANSGQTPTATTAPDLLAWDQTLDNRMLDWYMGNTADLNDANASFSGGSQNTQFLISGNFHQETNILSDANKYRRGNLHFSINHTSVNEKLKIGLSGLYATDGNKVQNSLAGNAVTVAQSVPNYPYYDADGNYNWLASKSNFYAISNAYTRANTQNLNLNVRGSYAITPKLSFITSIGLSEIANHSAGVQPSTSKNPAAANSLGSTGFYQTNTSTMLAEPQLSYETKIGAGSLSVIAGSTIQQSNNTVERITVTNYLSDLLIESRNGGTVSLANTAKAQYNFLSGFARLNYNYADRYIVNGTFRRDGSGRFGPNNRFGNFGSIGAAWIFSNETLIKDKFSWLSYGKLRGSYGTTGSDGIGDFGYLSLYATTADYGTQKAILATQIANDDFQWEVTKKMEVALELGVLKDRILFSAAWYRNRSGNQLVTYPLPATTGFSGYVANLPALVENSGLELDVNTINFRRSGFTWTSSVNLTIPRNRLVSFANIERTSYANTLIIGKPLKSYLAYKFTGIDPATGIAGIADIDGNGAISINSSYNNRGGDKVYVGSGYPDWYAGLNNSLSISGFQLDFFFQYTKQIGYNLLSGANGMNAFGTMQNGFAAYLNYWKSPNDGATVPKPTAVVNSQTALFANSDAIFGDASFLRLKTVSLRYQLSEKLSGKLKIPQFEIFAQGQNLWTLTKYDGSDPEQAPNFSVGVPTLRSFTFGLKSTF